MNGPEIVGFVAHHLPRAIEWAEAELLATRRARKHHLDRAVRLGVCAVGHPWATIPGPDRPLGCGYCASAREHLLMWLPPDPAALVDEFPRLVVLG